MELSPAVREKIDLLPTDAFDLNNHHVEGILVRHRFARQYLCELLAREPTGDPQESLLLDALQSLVELDVPAMLRAIARM